MSVAGVANLAVACSCQFSQSSTAGESEPTICLMSARSAIRCRWRMGSWCAVRFRSVRRRSSFSWSSCLIGFGEKIACSEETQSRSYLRLKMATQNRKLSSAMILSGAVDSLRAAR